MTNEASTMVVVARVALEGALRAALPHVARRIPEDATNNGAGLGWSAGSVMIQAPVTGELLHDGPSIPYLEAALLPPVPVGSVAEPAGLRVYEGGDGL